MACISRQLTRCRHYPSLQSFRYLSSKAISQTFIDPWQSLGLSSCPSLQDENIYQLPEVSQALEATTPSKESIESLKRAVDVFGSMPSARASVLALLAEHQHAVGDSKGTQQSLKSLQNEASSASLATIALATSKHFWLYGEMDKARGTLDTGLDDISVANGRAIIQLMTQVDTLDDLFGVRDPFRAIVNQMDPKSFGAAVAQLNFGISELMWSLGLMKLRDLDPEEIPYTTPLRSWKKGLTILERHVKPTNPIEGQVIQALEARLLTCMSYVLLQIPDDDDHVSQASDFANQALQIHEKLPLQGMDFVLRLVAECYRRSGGAVTAEGLLQTAMDKGADAKTTLALLHHRETVFEYSRLCHEWDKREGEAASLSRRVDNVNSSLPELWQDKSVIHASLWFWLPSQLG